ncbi:hypothetical protein QA601_00930 [Chitinispirillales bacterium ANBcel5]|nr:hypothetical protein [Chitinispirillales bacterium ANBcel5]
MIVNKRVAPPAVILAAGMGKRLGCESVPKPMVRVNGVALIDNH